MGNLYRKVKVGDLIGFTTRGYSKNRILALVLEAYHYDGVPERFESLFYVYLITYDDMMFLEPQDLIDLEVL
tara:strand:+ start:3684 stop:3899 length:216 start_codon:yes stop_codon:yes gene_type:complete